MKRLTFLAVIVSILVVGMPARPVLSVIDTATNTVIDSAIIPLTGTVGDVSFSGVVHVVTKVMLQEPTPFSTGFLTVSAYLVPSDVSAVDQRGNTYLAHGASTATLAFADVHFGHEQSTGGILFVTSITSTGTPFAAAPTQANPVPAPVTELMTDAAIKRFDLQLNLGFTSDGVLDAIHSAAQVPLSQLPKGL